MPCKPLELYKGLGTKGGIIRFPVIQITGNIIINRAAFPTGFGQKSREYIATLIDSSLKSIAKTEKDIAEKYWVDVLETALLHKWQWIERFCKMSR